MTSSQQTWETEKGQHTSHGSPERSGERWHSGTETRFQKRKHTITKKSMWWKQRTLRSVSIHSTREMRWAWGLRCRACTWTNVISSYRYQETRGTKNNCMRVQLGQSVDKRFKKTKNSTATSKVSGQRQGPAHTPCTHHHEEGGQTTQDTSLAWPLDLSPPSPRNQLTRLLGGRAGHVLLVLPCSTAAWAPVKPCLNFSPDLSSIPTDGDGLAPGWPQKEQVGHKGQWRGDFSAVTKPGGFQGRKTKLRHRKDTRPSQNTAEQADQQHSRVMYSKSEIFQLLFSSFRWILLKWDFVN